MPAGTCPGSDLYERRLSVLPVRGRAGSAYDGCRPYCHERTEISALLVAQCLAGKIRYIGFTGHKDPHIHLHMLDVAREHGFVFDSVQMPLNVMDAHCRSFGKLVLPELVKQGTGVLGMKPMANGIILKSNTVSPRECLHYSLNLPTSVVITGVDSMEILDQACEAARTFRPLSDPELTALLSKTATAAARGEFEPFKTSSIFDGTAQNPAWLAAEPQRLQDLIPGTSSPGS